LQKRNLTLTQGLDAARLAEEEFDFDEGFAGLDAARRAEKVAADLDAGCELKQLQN
jgi:hypothetical protein